MLMLPTLPIFVAGQADGVVNQMGDLLGEGGFNGEQGNEVGAANILLYLGMSKPASHDADAAPKRKMPKRSSKFRQGKKRGSNCKIGRVTLVLNNTDAVAHSTATPISSTPTKSKRWTKSQLSN